jgi:hypothetical protein
MRAHNANCPQDMDRYSPDCVATISIVVILFSHDFRKSIVEIETLHNQVSLRLRNKTYNK